MARFSSPLNRVRVAAPCPADWNEMAGTDRVRFCQQCNLNVYNLSSMTRWEAEAFVARAEGAEGRVCIRYYRRADGTILTNNCPVGLRSIHHRVSRTVNALVAAALGLFAGLGIYFFGTPTPSVQSGGKRTIALPVVVDGPERYTTGNVTTGTAVYMPDEIPAFTGRMPDRRAVKGRMK